MAKSIVDRIKERRAAAKKLSEQKQEELYKQVLDGLVAIGEHKEFYAEKAKYAIAKVRSANDAAAKQNAMRELKAAYGFYHYMSSMHDAFATIRSQMQLQAVTQEFAGIVKGLSSIRYNEESVNFAALTRKALRGFRSLNTSSLDDMVDSLVRGSIAATESEQASDEFFEDLIAGKVSLDTPYPSKTLEEYDRAKKQIDKVTETGASARRTSKTSEIMDLLDQITAGLRDE